MVPIFPSSPSNQLRRRRSLSFSATLGAVSAGLVMLTPGSLRAETPAGLLEQKKVSEGSSEVAEEGFKKAVDPEAAPPPEDATELSVAAGALMAGGNSRSAAGTGVLRFQWRRAENQVTGAAAANYAQSAVRNEQMETTVENYQGNLRYDYFLSPNTSVFFSTTARRDRFQGLDLRLNLGPGVAFYVVRNQESRLWAEIGYDFQHDLRTRKTLDDAAAEGIVVERDEQRHNARLFAGYEHRFHDKLRFDSGIEYIRQLFVPADLQPARTNWRLNYTSALSTELVRRLSFATAVTAMYDNNPLPNVARLDVMTSFNLVYSLL